MIDQQNWLYSTQLNRQHSTQQTNRMPAM